LAAKRRLCLEGNHRAKVSEHSASSPPAWWRPDTRIPPFCRCWTLVNPASCSGRNCNCKAIYPALSFFSFDLIQFFRLPEVNCRSVVLVEKIKSWCTPSSCFPTHGTIAFGRISNTVLSSRPGEDNWEQPEDLSKCKDPVRFRSCRLAPSKALGKLSGARFGFCHFGSRHSRWPQENQEAGDLATLRSYQPLSTQGRNYQVPRGPVLGY